MIKKVTGVAAIGILAMGVCGCDKSSEKVTANSDDSNSGITQGNIKEEGTSGNADIIEEKTYTVTSEDLQEIINTVHNDIVNYAAKTKAMSPRVEEVDLESEDFKTHFVTFYDNTDLLGIGAFNDKIAENFDGYNRTIHYSLDINIDEINFDEDGFTYYEDSEASLVISYTTTFNMWDDHDSSFGGAFEESYYASLLLEDGNWVIEMLSDDSEQFDFKHIDDENRKGNDDSEETEEETEDKKDSKETEEETEEETTAEAESSASWQDAYVDFFTENSDSILEYIDGRLVDINGDEIPEIIYNTDTEESVLYMIVNYQVVVLTLPTVTAYNPDNNVLIAYTTNDLDTDMYYMYTISLNIGDIETENTATKIYSNPDAIEYYINDELCEEADYTSFVTSYLDNSVSIEEGLVISDVVEDVEGYK